MKKNLFIASAIIALAIPSCTFAWGKKGHTMVAEVAFNLLDPKTTATVNKYLDGMSPEQAANWMDEIKGDHTLDYMKPWHYVNVEDGKTYEETKEANIINQLSRVIAELEHHDKMSNEDIKKDLLIIFHLTGDLHQPLHVGYGIDKGGNTIQLQFNGHGTNLHRLWDTEIIEKENITTANCLALLISLKEKDIKKLSVISVQQWMSQPRAQLKTVYNFKDGKIDETYTGKNREVIVNEITIAGIRLAAILKDVFKS